MTLYLMVLEPLEDRYTGQWYEWFPQTLAEMDVDYEVIEGDDTDHELEGEYFLDPVGTNYYKLTQMAKLVEKLDELEADDTVFFFDLWYPGLEILPYVQHMTDMEFNIAGCLHAGTYDPADLTAQNGMESFGSKLEESWFSVVDDIFVASEFHKQLITDSRIVDESKLHVTGLPVDVDGMAAKHAVTEREDRIAFTGRKSEEKGIELVRELQDEGYPVEVTLDYDMDKEEYYDFLAKSKGVIAPCDQETFGYGVVEAMALDVTPIVPDKLSYKDIVPKRFRYEDEEEARRRIEQVLSSEPIPTRHYAMQFQHQDVIKRMVDHVNGN